MEKNQNQMEMLYVYLVSAAMNYINTFTTNSITDDLQWIQFRPSAWDTQKKENTNLVVPRGGDQKVCFGTETEAWNGVGRRLSDL